MIFTSQIFVLYVLCVVPIWTGEPWCSAYDYDEKLLSKMIRMEIRLENLEKKLDNGQPDMRTSSPGKFRYMNVPILEIDITLKELLKLLETLHSHDQYYLQSVNITSYSTTH